MNPTTNTRRGAILAWALAGACLATTWRPAMAAPGDLDPSFSLVGRVRTDFNGFVDVAGAVAVQADGKIVAAGDAALTFAVARYHPNGSLDTSFGAGGKVTTPMGDRDVVTAVALQPDGKIVLAGATNIGLQTLIALARYTSNGTLDSSFGAGGKVLTAIGSAAVANAIALQSDGKILVAGSSSPSPTAASDFALVRYNVNGVFDSSFDGDGKVLTDFVGGSDAALAVALLPNGTIVAAGYASFSAGGPDEWALARYERNGALDTSFDGDGKVRTSFGGAAAYATSMVVFPNGKVLAAGSAPGLGGQDMALARYNRNGSLDTSFGTGGKVLSGFGGGDQAFDTVVQSDGKIVTVGSTDGGPTSDFVVARFTVDGSLDSSFGMGGKVLTDFGGGEVANGVTLQSDGKIVVAGSANVGGSVDFALARYLGR